MTVWDVHVTYRDESGMRRTDLIGAYAADELAVGLASAWAHPNAQAGGVQVTRQRPLPKPSPGPQAA